MSGSGAATGFIQGTTHLDVDTMMTTVVRLPTPRSLPIRVLERSCCTVALAFFSSLWRCNRHGFRERENGGGAHLQTPPIALDLQHEPIGARKLDCARCGVDPLRVRPCALFIHAS